MRRRSGEGSEDWGRGLGPPRQMIEDLFDCRRIFDARNAVQGCTNAARAGCAGAAAVQGCRNAARAGCAGAAVPSARAIKMGSTSDMTKKRLARWQTRPLEKTIRARVFGLETTQSLYTGPAQNSNRRSFERTRHRCRWSRYQMRVGVMSVVRGTGYPEGSLNLNLHYWPTMGSGDEPAVEASISF